MIIHYYQLSISIAKKITSDSIGLPFRVTFLVREIFRLGPRAGGGVARRSRSILVVEWISKGFLVDV